MPSRLGLMLPLMAALALPGAALATQSDATGSAPSDVVQLAQGKSDDAKGKAKAKAKEKAKAKAKAEAKGKGKAKGAEKKAEKQAAKDAKKAEKEADKAEKVADKEAKGHAGDPQNDDARKKEMEKHERRLAKIARLDALAANGKKDKLKEKASHLREIENKRHTRALARIDSQGDKAADADDGADKDAPEEKKAAAGDDEAPAKDDADKPTRKRAKSKTDKGGER